MDTRATHDPGGSARIKMGHEDEVRYWCEKFGVTKARLEDAVNAVGPDLDRVQEFLAQSHD